MMGFEDVMTYYLWKNCMSKNLRVKRLIVKLH